MPPGSDPAGALHHVERARPQDAAALATLAADAVLDPWSEQGFAAEIANEAARIWVVRGPREEVLGYVAVRHVVDEIHVSSLAVTRDARRAGIGTALVGHALAAPAARVAHLEVRSDDAGAQAFYTRLGFRPLGRRARFYASGIDAILMSADLTGPP